MGKAVDQDVSSVSMVPQPRSINGRCTGALVMDADYRGLGAVRSLGRHGVPVWVLHHGDHLLASFSRYTRRNLCWPSRNDHEKVDFLVDLADREGVRGWVLFPTGDEGAALVARNHNKLGKYFRLTTPPWDVLRWAYDKRLMNQLADSAGVSYPWTIYPANRDELAASEFPYPVILKPAYRSGFNRLSASKAWRVENREQLLARYVEASMLVERDILMIQELIPGGGESQFSYTALCQNGRILASLTARRTRQIPMDFGRASTFVETVGDPEPGATAVPLLSALRYTGIVEVEFKRDPRDSNLKLLDINPRVWGWQSLCGAAGVDYPYLLWLMTTGEPVPATNALVGVRWVRMSTDMPTAIREILRGRLSLREYSHSVRPPLAPAIYAHDDPLPGLLETPLLVYLMGRRVIFGGRIA